MTDDVEPAWRAAAARNLLEARKKRGHIPIKKSRSGCVACKKSKVKCDEQRPVCGRCATSSRTCEYSHDLSPGSSSGSRTAASTSPNRQLSRLPGLTDGDKRSLDYFIAWSAPRIAGSLDQDFWCRRVIALSYQEPVILDALIAISTLYENPQYMKSFLTFAGGDYPTVQDHPALSGKPIDHFHANALRHYNRAIRTLREAVDPADVSPTVALLSCALFTCIEILRDDVFSALALLKNGVMLVQKFSTCPSDMDESLFLSIKGMFLRMSLVTAMFGHAQPLNALVKVDAPTDRGNEFESLDDARTALCRLLSESVACLTTVAANSDAARHILITHSQTHGTTARRIEDETDSRSLPAVMRLHNGCEVTNPEGYPCTPDDRRVTGSSQQSTLTGTPRPLEDDTIHRLSTGYLQWFNSFLRFYPHEDERSSSLLMLYHVAVIIISTGLPSMQNSFDQYTHQFAEIVRLAKIYNSYQSPKNTFTLELGSIAPLYFVATNCRVPSLRRDALRTIRNGPRKESSFGATSVAEVAARLVAIEEENLSLPPPWLDVECSSVDDSVLPAEEDRVHSHEILINKAAGRFELRVTRFPFGVDDCRHKLVQDYPI